MSLPISNHVTISENGITIDGTPLLVEQDSFVLTGYDDPNEVTKIMLTLIPSEVTIKQMGPHLEEGDSAESAEERIARAEQELSEAREAATNPDPGEATEPAPSVGTVYVDVMPRFPGKPEELEEMFKILGLDGINVTVNRS